MSKLITNIIFTKNRPLQLDAYLESLHRYFPAEHIQSYVIYKKELFKEQYDSLFNSYPNCIVIKESDFHTDCLTVINQVDTPYILFGIDDVVYFDSVDFELIDQIFNKFGEDIFGFSLRFSKQIVEKGGDPVNQFSLAGQTVYSINWTKGQTPVTRYPFELCATIYKTQLVKKILKSSRNNNQLLENIFAPDSSTVSILSKVFRRHSLLKKFGYFYNPNTFESWNCRWCQNNSSILPPILFFQKICATAIQVNMVNTSTNNQVDGFADHAVEALAEKYKQGYRFDVHSIEKNKPDKTHCGCAFFKLQKNIECKS